jgi:glucokinase
MLALGIDVGGTSVKAAALRDGRVVGTGRSGDYEKPDKPTLVAAMTAAVGDALGKESDVDVAGICVPGLLDESGRRVRLSVNAPGLNGLPLDDLVAHSIGIALNRPVVVLNDALAAAHDVFVTHRPKGRLLVLALGTGVGAAVLDDGVPLRVEGPTPGHLGQIDVSIDGAPVVGPDGGAGGLEGYIGAPALAARFGSAASAASKMSIADAPILGLVRAIRIAHAIYRPAQVVLVGGVGIRLRHLAAEIDAAIRCKLTNVARSDWALWIGDDDFHAARGAARLAQTMAETC